MNTLYEMCLAQTSALKLSAPRLRASGKDGPIEAAIALHEAARIERRAIAVLGPLDAATMLRASVERCGLLLDAGDATRVVRSAWPEVLERAEALGEALAQPMLVRLRPAVDRVHARLDALAQTLPHLPRLAAALQGFGAVGGAAARRELHTYLQEFPGDTVGWINLVAVERMIRKDTTAAWSAVQVLRRMDPELEVGQAMELALGVLALAPEALRARVRPALAAVREGRASSKLALAVAGALVHLGQNAETRAEDLAAAEEALRYGLPRLQGDDRDRALFRATLAIIEDMRSGRPVRADVYRRVGLPEFARAGAADPMQVLRNHTGPMPALAL